MGYMHRGYEKLTEVRTYPQVTTLVNRIDWLGSFANEVPFILAAEQLMDDRGAAAGPVDPHRALRDEPDRQHRPVPRRHGRCSSARSTPAFYAFRDREYVLNQIEAVTGGRFHPNFDRIGGLKDDLPKGWIDDTKAVMEKVRDFCDEIEDLVTGNEIFQARTRGIGVIPADVALSYGLPAPTSGPSGVDWDLRRDVARRPGLERARLEGLDPPRRRLASPATGCASRRSARRRKIVDQLPRRPARPGRSWPRCPASSRCPRARPTSRPRTRSARWATTSSPRATSGRSG